MKGQRQDGGHRPFTALLDRCTSYSFSLPDLLGDLRPLRDADAVIGQWLRGAYMITAMPARHTRAPMTS